MRLQITTKPIRLRSSWRPMLAGLPSLRTISQARRYMLQAGWVLKNAASALTLIGVLFIGYHLVHANAPTISSQGSDPKDPFHFPFTIRNDSHVLAMRNLRWVCHLIRGEGPTYSVSNVGFWIGGTAKRLSADDILNISCKQAVELFEQFSVLVLEIQLRYDTPIVGPLLIPRSSQALFTWMRTAANPQWIRGSIAK